MSKPDSLRETAKRRSAAASARAPEARAVRTGSARLGREQRIDHILCAARDMFCEKGYEHTAVAEIAARIGVVEGTVYKYFDSKRALLLKVLERWYEDMFGDYARDLAGVVGARLRLRLLVWRHLRSIRDFPLLCRLMFREVRSEQDYRGSELHALNRRYTQLLTDVIADGIAACEFRGDLPAWLLRDLVYGGIEHSSWNFICGRGALDIDRLADQLVAVLCDGISARRTADQLRLEAWRLSRMADRMAPSPSRRPRKTAARD